jgi:hypothetical protein
MKGNRAANINDIEKSEIISKDGIGYDSERLPISAGVGGDESTGENHLAGGFILQLPGTAG